MIGRLGAWRRLRPAGLLTAVLLTITSQGQPAAAQTPSARLAFSDSPVSQPQAPAAAQPTAPVSSPILDTNVEQAQCPACASGGGVLSPYGGAVATAGCASCGSGMPCSPGREKMPPCPEGDGVLSRFFCCLYQCICCPDPCYEGKWTPVADSAFYLDSARPQTQTRIRVEPTYGLAAPDRAEFFWAQADGKGKGPGPQNTLAENQVDYTDTRLYTEAATGKVGVFFEMSYLSLDPLHDPHAAGFGDMNTGIKTLLLDCEMMQFAMQFKTYLPVGNAGKGLGTGHVSLEPSLLMTLKLAERSYLQGQVAEWIPVGGDAGYQGAILHYHFSWNNQIYQFNPACPVVATAEFNGWTFQTGSYTDPINGPFQRAAAFSYFELGPGLRFFICDKVDLGCGVSFALNEPNWYQTTYRTELRFRF
jgi:hypothetical protein